MLSLSPRFDLFNFQIPEDWFPQEILDKYRSKLMLNPGVIADPVQYVNESIQGISIPGMSDLTVLQSQIGTSTRTEPEHSSLGKLSRIREPKHDIASTSPDNILEHIEREFRITFRQNQGLYNYFMIYETIMWHYAKDSQWKEEHTKFKIHILDENGSICASIVLDNPIADSIDGIEFSFSKVERSSDTFDVSFNFNNIDFEF